MSDGDLRVEDARAATGDKLATAEGNRFFEKCDRQRRADAGVDDGEAHPVLLDDVNWVMTDLAMKLVKMGLVGKEAGDHVVEEAEDAVFGQILQPREHIAPVSYT